MKTEFKRNHRTCYWFFLPVLFLNVFLLLGCQKHQSPPSITDQSASQSDEKNYQEWKDKALAHAAKLYEERLKNPTTNQIRLPNFEAGPGRPRPNYLNFYTMDDRYPSYLLCEYAVKENPYYRSNESGWIKKALEQIRKSGSKMFPPIKWVAVTVRNVAEHKDESTFERSFKVGAIFKSSDVFDSSRDLSVLVSQSEMDRHPFLFDEQQPTSGEQQRWVIVERHLATNDSATGTVKP